MNIFILTCEKLECVFDKFPKVPHEYFFGHFNAKEGRDAIFKPTIRNDSLHEISTGNGVRVVNFATSKNLIVRNKMFSHRNIHKFSCITPEGKSRNKIGHILIYRRWHSSARDGRSFREADCNTDQHLVVANVRDILAVSKQTTHRFHMERYNLKELKELKGKEKYQSQIGSQFWKTLTMMWILIKLGKLLERIYKF
jgi:hypothetical protein